MALRTGNTRPTWIRGYIETSVWSRDWIPAHLWGGPLARAMPTAGLLLGEGHAAVSTGRTPAPVEKRRKRIMSAPRDQYPNDAWKYPGGEPEAPESARPSFGPAVEAELYRLAPSRVTVLLIGGDARERHAVAVALHERSPRARSPFIAFACEGPGFEAGERGPLAG